jgi:ribosomal protein S6
MFGGGPKNAFPYFEKASELFQNEKNDDIYKPYWGKRQNAYMLNKCREALK